MPSSKEQYEKKQEQQDDALNQAFEDWQKGGHKALLRRIVEAERKKAIRLRG